MITATKSEKKLVDTKAAFDHFIENIYKAGLVEKTQKLRTAVNLHENGGYLSERRYADILEEFGYSVRTKTEWVFPVLEN